MHWCLDLFSSSINYESASIRTEQGCRAWLRASHSHIQSRILLHLSVVNMQNFVCQCREAQKLEGEGWKRKKNIW